MTEQTPAQRLRDAATIVEQTIADASPLPWTYFEDHGRDHSDEGWSEVGMLDANGKHVAHTYGPGYEGNDQPEHDAALAILLTATARPLIGLMREAAIRYDAILAPPTNPPASPAEGDFHVGEDGMTRVWKGDAWLVVTIPDPVARGMVDVADAILSRGVRTDA